MNTNLVAKQYQLNEWAQMVKSQKDSGLSVGDWCAGNNVTRAAFYYRLRKVREACIESLETIPSSIVPISKIIEEVDHISKNEEPLSIIYKDLELRIIDGTPLTLLESVLKVLRHAQ